MAVLAPRVLAAALLEDDDLVVLLLLEDGGGHDGARNQRHAERHAGTLADGEDLVELHLFAAVGDELLDGKDVVGSDPVLLAAGADDRKHGINPIVRMRRARGAAGARRPWSGVNTLPMPRQSTGIWPKSGLARCGKPLRGVAFRALGRIAQAWCGQIPNRPNRGATDRPVRVASPGAIRYGPPPRGRGARVVDRGGLENRCTFWVPWVRIPPSPPLTPIGFEVNRSSISVGNRAPRGGLFYRFIRTRPCG
jgi:hypothetical protein